MKTIRWIISITFILVILTSCGQRGDLIRPVPDEQKVEAENAN